MEKINKQISRFPTIAIVLLNWNKWSDTVECLESICKSNINNLNVILVDNGSINDSVEKIKDWLNGDLSDNIDTDFTDFVYPLEKKPINFSEYDIDNIDSIDSYQITNKDSLLFFKIYENIGFARAVNFGWYIAKEYLNYDYLYLLNNDTVITPTTIKSLVDFVETNPDFGLVSSTIYNYYKPEKIDQAGGKISLFGRTRYYKNIKPGEAKTITFASGCSMLISKRVLDQFGLFTDRFFFGEEDVDFSMRLKKQNVKIACIEDSRVYHKIGQTSKEYFETNSRKVFIHRLNRIINMKQYFLRLNWTIWLYLTFLYFIYFDFAKTKRGLIESLKDVIKLNNYAFKYDSVTKSLVSKIFKEM